MAAYIHRLNSFLKRIRNVLLPDGDAVSHIAAIDMFAHNWYLGFTSFGGPTVHFQIFRKLFVEKYQWDDESTYQELFAVCQALSGPGSTKMLYSLNVIHYDVLTGLLAFFVWSVPMAAAALGLAYGVDHVGEQLPSPVYALLTGMNSATVGIIALAAYQLSQKAITDTLSRILVFLGATAGMLYNALWYFPVLMVAGGVAAMIHDLRLLKKGFRPVRRAEDEEGASAVNVELEERRTSNDRRSTRARTVTQQALSKDAPPDDHLSSSETREEPPRQTILMSWKMGAALLAAFLAIFIAIMVCRAVFGGRARSFDVFANLYLAGTIIFGGGPVVVPLLREYIVAPGWVSPRDFLLGLAIIQAFPGPNFNFAVYLGALAVAGTSTPIAVGAIIGFVAIFTPGLWLQSASMGLWASVRKLQAVRACLRGVHAAAVGLVFTAVYRLFEVGYIDKNVQSGASLGRDPWWVVIVATSFVGGLHFRLSPVLAILLGATMGMIQYGVSRA